MRHLRQLFTSRAGFVLALFLGSSGCQTLLTEPCITPSFEPLLVQLSLDEYTRLNEAPTQNAHRSTIAKSYLSAAGCDLVISFPIPRSTQQNHLCVIPGDSTQQIVVGAHYDKIGGGKGIADNWSGVVLTAKLIEHFARNPPNHTLLFVLFGEEEAGMKGSEAFIAGRDITDIALMINIDTLGIGPVTIDRRSEPVLQCAASGVAGVLGIESRSNRLHESTSDWEPFNKKGVPFLNFHSMDRRSFTIVHTNRDRRRAINDAQLDQAWQVILNSLVYLDGSDEDLVER